MLWSQITPEALPAIQAQFHLPPDIVAVEYTPLPFFKNAGFLKMIFGPGNCYYTGIAIGSKAIEETSAVIPLCGRGHEMHLARMVAGMHLPTEAEAVEWAKFFSGNLYVEGSNFLILHDLEGYAIEPHGDQPIEFHAPRCTRDPDIAGQYNIRCFVKHRGRIFSADYIVGPDGYVDMVDDLELGTLHTAH